MGSLKELLVVVIIIGILLTVMLFHSFQPTQAGQKTQYCGIIESIQLSIEAQKNADLKQRLYPTTLNLANTFKNPFTGNEINIVVEQSQSCSAPTDKDVIKYCVSSDQKFYRLLIPQSLGISCPTLY